MKRKPNFSFIRGRVIEKCTQLEFAIDTYIANHFVKDVHKQDELIYLILASRMTFENKRQVLDYLIKEHNKPVLASYPTLLKDIQRIVEQRNILAHYPSGIYGDGEGTVTNVLFRLKNTFEVVHYEHSQYEELMVSIKSAIKIVNKII